MVQTFFDTMTARDAERKVMTAEGRFYAMDVRKPTDAFDRSRVPGQRNSVEARPARRCSPVRAVDSAPPWTRRQRPELGDCHAEFGGAVSESNREPQTRFQGWA